MNVTAIVLAAGTSSRMGQPKQLLQFEGKSLVRRAAEAAVDSKARQTIVVTGAGSAAVDAELAGLAVMLVHNPEFAEGMSTSLQAGLRAVRPEVDAVVVLLADQPFVTPEIVDGLIDLYERTGAKIVRPRYGEAAGQSGALGPSGLFAELMEQEGDQGGRALLQKYRDEIAWLELPDQGQQTDVDTPEAYASLTGEESPHSPALSRRGRRRDGRERARGLRRCGTTTPKAIRTSAATASAPAARRRWRSNRSRTMVARSTRSARAAAGSSGVIRRWRR